MNPIVIQFQHIKKIYKLYEKPQDRFKETFSIRNKKYSRDFYALNDITFAIEKGECVGIVGKNGSGKSTLLKILTGVLNPTSGEKAVNGKISALLELGAGFNMEFSGMENIFLNGTIMNIPREEMEKKVEDIVNFADIGDFIYQPVKTYSSGMFVRLAFAVAINVEPDILIVDEALAVGDTRFQLKCMDKFIEFVAQEKTVIFVSHDINMVKRFCKRAIWINEGQMVMDGLTDPVTDRYEDFLRSGLSFQKYMEITGSDEEEEGVIATTDIQKENGQMEQKGKNGEEEKIKPDDSVIAEVNALRIYNKEGKAISEIQHGEDITLKVDYSVYETGVDHPVLGVAIRSIDHVYICGINTLLDKCEIPWKMGRNTMTLAYHNFNLTGGNYYFDVILFDQTATVPFSAKNQIKNFFVRMGYIAEGIVVLEHSWSKDGKTLKKAKKA